MLASTMASAMPTAERPVVVCDAAHAQDACVQFFGSDGNIRSARVTVLGPRPYLANGQPMGLVAAFSMLETQAAEREQMEQERGWSRERRAQMKANEAAANYARHGDPDPWDGDEGSVETRVAVKGGSGSSRMVVEIVAPPVVK